MGDPAENLSKHSLLKKFKSVEHFCKVLLDAFALVDGEGRIVKCNQLFAQVVGLTTRQILRVGYLDSVLELSINDTRLSVQELLNEVSPTRIDEVSGSSVVRPGLNLILGIYPFIEGRNRLGTFILIRDVTAETKLQDKYKDKATESITDHLTGLYNRNYFRKYLDATAESLEKIPGDSEQKQLSVIMLDIDHFKKINDVYGHQAGDHVLQSVAILMKSICRKTDVVCRYGGEEFVAIVPATHLEGAFRVAQKFRLAIEDEVFEFNGKRIPVTISCGVAQFQVNCEKIDETIARADAALYRSKANGRNQVSLHDGSAIDVGSIFFES